MRRWSTRGEYVRPRMGRFSKRGKLESGRTEAIENCFEMEKVPGWRPDRGSLRDFGSSPWYTVGYELAARLRAAGPPKGEDIKDDLISWDKNHDSRRGR